MDKCKICASVLSLVFFLTWTAQAVHIYDPAGQNGMHFGAALSELRNDADQPGSWLGILIGTPDYPGSGTTHGRVYVWFGGAVISLSADFVLTGQNNELFGYAVQRVGDVNGDGWDDFAVGAPGYDGSGTDLIAVFRPGGAWWSVRGFTTLWFGTSGDWPAPGDFDGDGTREAAVYRPAFGLWIARGVTRIYHGTCRFWPKPGDYHGDGRDDDGVFRTDPGYQWVIKDVTGVYFGTTGYLPVTR